MEIQSTALQTRPTGGDAVSRDGLCDGISTSTAGLSESEVVVRRDVEAACADTVRDKGSVIIIRRAVVSDNCSSRDTGDRGRETVVQTGLEPSAVERIKVGVEWCESLQSVNNSASGRT